MSSLLGILIAGALIPVFVRKAEWGLLILLGIVVFFREGWHPDLMEAWVFYDDINLAGIRIMEMLAYPLFVIVLINKKIFLKQPFWIPTYTPLLLLFMASFGFAVANGFAQGAVLKEVLGYGEWRALFLALCLFILVPNIITTPQKAEWLLRWLFVMVAARTLWGFGRYLFAAGDLHPTLKTKIVFWDSGEQIMLGSMIVLAAAQWIWARRKKTVELLSKLMMGGIMLSAILLSLRRSYWLFLGVSLASLAWFAPSKAKIRIAVILALAGSVGAAVSLFGSPAFLEKITDRVGSYFSTTEDTNSFHLADIADAFWMIEAHPLAGVGFGNGFIRIKSLTGVGAEDIPPNIVHDVYLHIWLKMGLWGIIAFILFWLFFIFYARNRIANTADPALRAQAIGLFSVIFGMLGAFVFGTDLFANTRIPFFLFTLFSLIPALTSPAVPAENAEGNGLRRE